MQKKQIKLLKDDEIFSSLKSVQFENTDEGKTRFFGNNMHICDGLVRSAYIAKKKGLNIYIY